MSSPVVTVTYRVACPDGGIRHSGAFRDYGRAAHWALQDACCPGNHHVIPVLLTGRAIQSSGAVQSS